MGVELRLLSRVSYRDQEITGQRLRDLLALLAADLRTGCGTARLVSGLWPDEQPDNPTKAVQVLVSRARAQLGADLIVRTPYGYRLSLGEDQVDASAVLLHASASAQSSRAGDHAAALTHAEAGLALWEGDAAGGTGLDDPVSALRAARVPAYRSLMRARGLALSRLGRHAEAVGVLAGLAGELPRDEELLGELLRCEAATAGPATALARYDAYRRALRDELGTDPGPALRDEYRRLLDGTAPAVRHGVPHEPNPLLGRDSDLAAVLALLRDTRVASIVGAGGLGKTRLAYAVARQAEQRVVHAVALAGVTTDEDVAREVASVVGAGEPRRGPVGLPAPADDVAGIAAALGPGPALLVLDNCEHVVGGVAELVRALVSYAKDVRVLTTSRAPLGLSSESVYPLPELSPATTAELFRQRARAARPAVELPDAAVAELCRHLDGLPLAVELAAARVRGMSVAEISRRLDDRFGLLRGGARDAPARHHTLHAVVDWSWNLLDPAGQAAMRALSVFPGGFTAEAARRVLGAGGGPEVLESLVDQSLLKVEDTASGARFRMLETVREFSAAHLAAAGETEAVLNGFLGWAREVGEAYHDAIFGPDPFTGAGVIRAEQDNLVHAFRHALTRADGATVAATTAALGSLWTVESHYPRLSMIVGEAAWTLSHLRPEPGRDEATRTALTLSVVFTFTFDGPRAVRALVALRRLPPAPPTTAVRAAAALLLAICDDPSTLYAMGDSDAPMLAGVANAVAGNLHESANDLDAALAAAERALEAFRTVEAPWLRYAAHCRVSELALRLERGAEARRHLMAALPVVERLGIQSDVDGVRHWLVLANLQVGDADEAERWLDRATPDCGEDRIGVGYERISTVGYELGVRAEVSLARGDVEGGLRAWRRVVDQLRAAGDSSFPGVPPELDPWVAEARAITVVAHAQHGRLDLVAHLVRDLPDRVSTMVGREVDNPPAFLVELPLCGTLLAALAMVDLDRAGDDRARAAAARLVALAERFGILRSFQPTMSSTRIRRAARDADRPAYDDAVSAYAGLGPDELRAAAHAALRDRDARTG